jgi:isopenicillin-N N-acyltransferase-like protein
MPVSNRLLPLIRVAGTHYEIGRGIGAAAMHQCHAMVTEHRRMLVSDLGCEYNVALDIIRPYLGLDCPELAWVLQEMQGIADGARLSIEDVWLVNCWEELVWELRRARRDLHCTTLAAAGRATADGHTLLGHNEDWRPSDLDNVYLVHARPESAPALLALGYGPTLVNTGLNAAGIGQGCDSLFMTDQRLGLPRVVVARMVLAARSLSEAISAATHPQRAAGYNHLIADAYGQLVNVEVTGSDYDLLWAGEGFLVHTNDYQSPRLQARQQDLPRLIGSRLRSQRAWHLLKDAWGMLTLDVLQAVLADHANAPHSICCHPYADQGPAVFQSQTIASLVMDLSELRLRAAWGPPCQADYHDYRLAN